MKLKESPLTTLFIISYSSLSFAQMEIEKIWNTFTINGKRNDHHFQLETQLRAQNAPNTFYQFFNNFGVGYSIFTPLTLWTGVTYLMTGSAAANTPIISEYRLWQ